MGKAKKPKQRSAITTRSDASRRDIGKPLTDRVTTPKQSVVAVTPRFLQSQARICGNRLWNFAVVLFACTTVKRRQSTTPGRQGRWGVWKFSTAAASASLVLALSGVGGDPASAQTDDPDLENVAQRIRRANREYESSISSLMVVSRETVLQTGDGFNEEERLGLEFCPCRRTWARSGRQEVLFSDSDFSYEKRWLREWFSWDGKRSTSVDFFRHDPSRTHRATVEGVIPMELLEKTPFAQALGWRIRGETPFALKGVTIASLAERGKITDVSRETATFEIAPDEIVAFAAVKWRFQTFTSSDGIEHELVAWFDQTVNWLPRAWEIRPIPSSDTVPPAATWQSYRVWTAEFDRFPDPLIPEGRWFPKRVVIQNKLRTYDATAESITVNDTVLPEVFKPPLTEGTEIIYDPRTRMELTTHVGGEAGRFLMLELLKKENEFRGISIMDVPEYSPSLPDSNGQAVSVVDAAPVRPMSVATWTLLGAGLVFAGIVVYRLKWRS